MPQALVRALDRWDEQGRPPEDADPHDAEDFERGLRQLRRIVLARRSISPEATPGC